MTLKEMVEKELYKDRDKVTAYSKDTLDFILSEAIANSINNWIASNDRFKGKMNATVVKIESTRYIRVYFNSNTISTFSFSFKYGKNKDEVARVYLKEFEIHFYSNANVDFEDFVLEKLNAHKNFILDSIKDKLDEIKEIENFLLTK